MGNDVSLFTATTEDDLTIDESISENSDNELAGCDCLVGMVVEGDAVAENNSTQSGTTLVPLAVHEEEDELPAPRPTSHAKFEGMWILLLADRR